MATQMRTFRRAVVAAVLVPVSTGWLLAACGSSGTASGGGRADAAKDSASTASTAPVPNVPSIKITAEEAGTTYTFTGPTEAQPGPVLVELTNKGKLEHQAGIAKLKAGVSTQQAEDVLKAPDPSPLFILVDFLGGPNAVGADSTGKAIVTLTPGDYYIYCFIPDAAGKPHLAHGMVQRLKVGGSASSGTTRAASTPPVTSAGQITMKDFSVELPSDFMGKGWYKVVNEGKQPHEAAAYTLQPGKTVADFKTWQTADDLFLKKEGPDPGPPPMTPAGGVAAANPGVEQWVYLDLDPTKQYFFVCFIPDVEKGLEPHWMEGMITPWASKR